MQNRIMIDTQDDDNPIVIGSHRLAVTDNGPYVFWSREPRSSKVSTLRIASPDAESDELDRGMIGSLTVNSGKSGQLAAGWEKIRDDSTTELKFILYPGKDTYHPLKILNAEAASEIAVTNDSAGTLLAAWSEITDTQVIKTTCLDESRETQIISSPSSWASRPALCSMGRSRILVLWESYNTGGCSIQARVLEDGNVADTFSVFPASRTTTRYLNPVCVNTGDLILIASVEVTDVISEGNVIDQSSKIVTAFIDLRDENPHIKQAPSPAFLNHGLLADILHPTGVWGYLGPRRRPLLLSNGMLLWERKIAHDGFTPTEEGKGVLCFSTFDRQKESWSPEGILHRGSFAYEAALGPNSIWLLHRPVDPEKTQSLVLEEIPAPFCSGNGLSREYSSIELLKPETGYHPVANPEEIRGTNFPKAARSNKDFSLFWGDPHVHSGYSKDPEGEVDELLYYAKEVADLDFIAITDNDEHYASWLRDWERIRSFSVERAWHEDGQFVVLDGFEFTQTIPKIIKEKNHRTVLLQKPSAKLFRWSDHYEPGITDYELQKNLVRDAENTDALLILHHDSWKITDSPQEIGMEAASGWDTYIHDAESICTLWNNGRKTCLTGGSDNHRRNPGNGGALTGIWAKDLTYEGLIEGLLQGRTIATQGRRPAIIFYLEDEEGNTLFIGDSGTMHGTITAKLSIEIDNPSDGSIEFVELMHRQRTAANWDRTDTDENGRKLEVSHSLIGIDSIKEQSVLNLKPPKYLYVRLRMSGTDTQYPSNVANARGPWAWTTPIWWN
ncbi:MAG: hypothetical protein ACLFST_11305 [Spirochaetia bacterium]